MSVSASIVFVLSLLMALPGSCDQAAKEAETRIEPIEIEASQLGVGSLKLDSEIVGSLKYRGGLRLTSPDPRFGGLSSLNISADGRNFVAVSHAGYRFQGELVYDTRHNLTGITNAKIETFRPTTEKLFAGEKDGYCESIARTAGVGTDIVFKRGCGLVYREAGGTPRWMVPPEDLKDTLSSGSIKAMTLMPDNRLFALTAAFSAGGGVSGWVGGDDGWSKLTYTTCAREVLKMRHRVRVSPCFEEQKGTMLGGFEEFRAVAAATTPGGEIIVVESGLPYIATRLRLLQATDVKPMARLEAEELAVLDDSLAFHNIQGVHTRQASGGETLIYLVSNDNYTGPQPTVLLMFELLG
jgi:hypothetical protein